MRLLKYLDFFQSTVGEQIPITAPQTLLLPQILPLFRTLHQNT